jgi:hypothetical protein
VKQQRARHRCGKISPISLSAPDHCRKEKEQRGKKMKLRTPLLLAVASLSASFLHADAIFSNVGAGIPTGGNGLVVGASANGTYQALAFEFSPTTTAAFTDALVDVWSPGASGTDSSVTASLYSGVIPAVFESTGVGANLLAQLDTTTAPIFTSDPDLPFSSYATSFTQTSGPGVTLVAGMEYWLLLAPSDANSYVEIEGGAQAAGPVFLGATLFSPPSNTAPSLSPGYGAEFEIDGTPSSSSTPEPASLALLVSGLLVLCASRRFAGRP